MLTLELAGTYDVKVCSMSSLASLTGKGVLISEALSGVDSPSMVGLTLLNLGLVIEAAYIF